MKNKKTETAFQQYWESLSAADMEKVTAFFASLCGHILLARQEKRRLIADFEQALLYYASQNVALDCALERLNVMNLGGFYARPPVRWYPLDDAAKIYPLSMKHDRMSVFRLSVNLKAPVVPALLQIALSFTIKRFPSFATTVKKGFFWHYLDTAKRRYAIEPETDMPCRPLPVSRSGSQSFRVLYYQNRISAEYFHILTDGAGGMVFLKTLTAEYLRLLGIESCKSAGVLGINDPPAAGEVRNEFPRAGKTAKTSGFFDKPALQLGGRVSRHKPCRVLHFRLDAAKLKATAAGYQASVTAYALALLFLASRSAVDATEGILCIQVPVNMRRFYPSDTLRNFSMYCGIKLPLSDIGDLPGMLEEISGQLVQKASKEAMNEMMNAAERMVHMLRAIPLAVKTPAARLIYGFLGDRAFSNTLSNLGVVHMPPELEAHILSMDFVLGTALTARASCAMVTFGNTATLSISKMTADPSFEETLYRLLLADGLEAVVEGTAPYED